jgi:hypothetical protein
MEQLNDCAEDKITREESKRYLLKSINSMDLTSIALTDIYPHLGQWIKKCGKSMHDGKPLQTILGRKFRLAHSKNQLSVLNGVMQGSVAHAMQSVLRRVWEKLPDRIVCEIHDCLIVSTPPEPSQIKAIIDIVAPIMCKPFEDLLDDNPFFPINVSVGNRLRRFKHYRTYRQDESR